MYTSRASWRPPGFTPNEWANPNQSESPSTHSHLPAYQHNYGSEPNGSVHDFLRPSIQNSGDDIWAQTRVTEARNTIPTTSSAIPASTTIRQGGEPKILSRTAEEHEARTSTKKKARRRGQIHPRISPKEWEKYNEYLKDLYIEKQMTAIQIKGHMKDKLNFDASEQQYKNKFAEWGFTKKLRKDAVPQEVSEWILEKQGERERDGKKTEFSYNDRMVPVGRIKEAARESKIDYSAMVPFDKPTPQGLAYSTPAALNSAPSPFLADPLPRQPSRHELHSEDITSSELSLTFRLRWNEHDLQDLEAMVTEVEQDDVMKTFEQSESKLSEALSGFEDILGPCHERTVNLAYKLAELYANNGDTREADEVLERVGNNMIKTRGLDHPRTVKHLLCVIDIYNAWSRPKDAFSLLSRAVEYLEEKELLPAVATKARDGNFIEDVVPQNTSERRIFVTRRLENAEQGERVHEPRQVEMQLVIANAQVKMKNEEVETVLLDLIQQCRRFPGQFEVQIFKAHCSLIDLYYELDRPDQIQSALRNARDCFKDVKQTKSQGKHERSSTALLNASIDLASRFVKAGKCKYANFIFDHVEKEVCGRAETEKDGLDEAVSFLISMGMVYQKHGKWDYARPQFEHAYAITLASQRSDNQMARILQDALDNQNFSLVLLPRTLR